MYYDSSLHKFMCATDKGWQDCGGGGGPWEPTVPFIIKDSAGNIVLEINQE